MTTRPPIRVEYTDEFKSAVKHLRKKYHQINTDVQSLITRLESGDLPGDRIQRVGYIAYKVRLKSADLTKGKSGSYRVIYYVKTSAFIILITIYAKTEKADVDPAVIKRIIEKYKSQSDE